MQFVQPVITDEQAAALATIADLVIQRADELGIVWDEETQELENVQRLAVFMADVSEHPERYPVTGKMAATVKAMIRRATGPAVTPSRKNKRKARQESRMRTAKARRAMRQEMAESYNQAREAMERDAVEAQEAHDAMVKELEGQARFDVIGPNGEPILREVPESFIRPSQELPAELEEKGYQPSEIVLPAGVDV